MPLRLRLPPPPIMGPRAGRLVRARDHHLLRARG
nr:MAG TPA: hypothetical protein [Caudoviricetes sp.]